MWRDIEQDPREQERERPDVNRAGQRSEETPLRPERDPRSALAHGLELPAGRDRERVYTGDRHYDLNGAEVRTLAAAGAFRVVPERDLRAEPNSGHRDVRHLRELGLVETRAFVAGNTRTTLVSLSERGRDLLDSARRDRRDPDRQSFYAGVRKPRELAHDAQLYRAYARAATRIQERGGRVRRVVLEEEFKRSYQRFLQASNRGRRDSDGRPGRSPSEVADWARDQQLPLHDGRVQFPDVRIEYDDREGRRLVQDIEVTTPHYRGAHAAAKAQSGFTCYRSVGARIGGRSGGRSGGRGFDPRVAEEVLE